MNSIIRYSLGLALLTAVWPARADDQIQTYTVPKDHPPIPASTAPDLPVNASPIHWTTPKGWQELPATSFRLANLSVTGADGGKAEVAVTSFPGQVGTELENVNRWRRELKLAPVGESEVASEPVKVDGQDGKLYDIKGEKEETVVAVVPRNGATWFFKIRGDTGSVAEAKPAFMDFLQSVRIGGANDATASAPVANASAADPHAGLNINADTGTSGGDTPKWNVPANWTEKEPGPMIFKSYGVNEAGARAAVSISFFPGTVGGVLANVNRWRGQLGLAPVQEDQLGSVTQTVAGLDGNATFVDFTGTSKAGEPAQLVAAIVPHGDNTWFYKLIGDPAAVAHEKEAFVNFVKSVHYP